MDSFFIFFANYLYLVSFGVAGIYFLRQPRERQLQLAAFGLSCALISYGVALLAGLLYYDPRPFVQGHFTPLIAHDAENGFPSDHALLVGCLSVIFSFFNRRLSIFLWTITLLVAYARVYVGVHHFVDVIASLIITTLVGSMIYFLCFNQYIVPAAEKFRERYLNSFK